MKPWPARWSTSDTVIQYRLVQLVAQIPFSGFWSQNLLWVDAELGTTPRPGQARGVRYVILKQGAGRTIDPFCVGLKNQFDNEQQPNNMDTGPEINKLPSWTDRFTGTEDWRYYACDNQSNLLNFASAIQYWGWGGAVTGASIWWRDGHVGSRFILILIPCHRS